MGCQPLQARTAARASHRPGGAPTYDVIVVGARCGGSPTAMLLARKGYRVLLVDRVSFPRDTVSAHCVTIPGVARLASWGLRDAVAASGCPPILRMTVDTGDVAVSGSPPPLDGVAEQYCVRRTVLDQILVEAAVHAGAELRERFVVEELLVEDDRVAGVEGRDRHGTVATERARLVVGADGLHSVVARAVEAPTYAERPSLTCFAYAYWSGVALDGAEVHLRDGRAIFAFPTNDGLACIGMEWPAAEARAFRSDIEGNYLETLDLAPGLAARVRAGSREGRFVATADLPNFFRQAHGPGWALVGDAGTTRTPTWPRASRTPFATPSSSPPPSMTGSPAGGRWKRRWLTTRPPATGPPCPPTSSTLGSPACGYPSGCTGSSAAWRGTKRRPTASSG